MLPSALIIDDDEADRYLLRRLLKKSRAVDTIIECSDAMSALAFLGAVEEGRRMYPDGFPPTVVFLDINMPGMNGFEFLEAYAPLRARLEQESVVVVMWTSSVHPEDKRRVEPYTFVNGWIEKMPKSADALVNKLREAGLPIPE